MKITKYEKFGREIYVPSHLKGRHTEHCLCWMNCKNFKPDDVSQNCKIAQMNFEFCKNHGVTLPVWECSKYETEQFVDQNNNIAHTQKGDPND